MVADARRCWLGALLSAGALAGLAAAASGQPWGDPVAGLAITVVICQVGYQVTADVVQRLAHGVDHLGHHHGRGGRQVPGVSHVQDRAR